MKKLKNLPSDEDDPFSGERRLYLRLPASFVGLRNVAFDFESMFSRGEDFPFNSICYKQQPLKTHSSPSKNISNIISNRRKYKKI